MEQLQSLADAPGTLREYETIYILRPDTINEKVAELNDRVKGIIEERGGKILNVDNWGKRKLAYEVEKELKGIYLFWQYLGNPGIVAEFERNMRMLDPCIRYMTISIATNVESGSRESEVDGETFEKAATTAADEEEIMMGRAAAEAEAESSEAEASSEDAADASSEDAAAVDAAAADAGEASSEDAAEASSEDAASSDDGAEAATPDTDEEK